MKNNLTLIKNKSILLNVLRPIGQAVKTPPSHGGIMGSIPVWVTNVENMSIYSYKLLMFFYFLHHFYTIVFDRNYSSLS